MKGSGSIEDGVHIFPVRVYYSETDAAGIVYHTKYIDMAEHARTELLRLLGLEHKILLGTYGLGFVIKNINIDFKRPGALDDLLIIRTRISKLHRVAVTFTQEIMRGDEILCSQEVTVVTVHMESFRPMAIPEELRGRLELIHKE